MHTILEHAALFTTGFIVDIIATLAFIATARGIAGEAAIANFALIVAVDVSFYWVLDVASFQNSLAKIVSYAAGAAVGTYVCIRWKQRRDAGNSYKKLQNQ